MIFLEPDSKLRLHQNFFGPVRAWILRLTWSSEFLKVILSCSYYARRARDRKTCWSATVSERWSAEPVGGQWSFGLCDSILRIVAAGSSDHLVIDSSDWRHLLWIKMVIPAGCFEWTGCHSAGRSGHRSAILVSPYWSWSWWCRRPVAACRRSFGLVEPAFDSSDSETIAPPEYLEHPLDRLGSGVASFKMSPWAHASLWCLPGQESKIPWSGHAKHFEERIGCPPLA